MLIENNGTFIATPPSSHCSHNLRVKGGKDLEWDESLKGRKLTSMKTLYALGSDRTASNLSNSIFSFEFKSQSDGDDIFPFNVTVWLRCGITTSLNRRRRQRTSIASHTHTQRWLRLRRLLLDRNLLGLLVQLRGPCLEATTPQPWWRWHILTTIDFVGSIYS